MRTIDDVYFDLLKKFDSFCRSHHLKYYIDGRLYVKAEGVKWLNEKYYRRTYLKYLEHKKQNLDGYEI